MTSASGAVALHPAHSTRQATVALLLACLFWGGSFTWSKQAITSINSAAAAAQGSAFGPMLLIAWRFGIAGVLWLTIFPPARRGWSWRSVGRAIVLGALFAAGMIAQQMGLDRTSEATSAFLTSLSILFVPLLMLLTTGRAPPPALWAGIALATAGIWLMTGATPTGIGVGEILGLLCSLLFSIYLLAMNALVSRDDPWRMAGAQFLVIGILCGLFVLGFCPEAHRGANVLVIPFGRQVIVNLLLLVGFATIGGFGLMVIYQPRLDPARAALIYLVEPVFAASYAYLFVGAAMSATALIGGTLILLANGIVEWMEQRRRIKAPAEVIG
jgi:drug/metabolite transporter (DMT)-like permease